jgi:parvulin-like peptidyl-prolyl isomerase
MVKWKTLMTLAALAAAFAGALAEAGRCRADDTTGVATVPTVDRLATDSATTEMLTMDVLSVLNKRDAATTLPPRQPGVPDLLSTQTIVLAEYDGGRFTNHDLSATLKLRKPRDVAMLTPEQVMSLPAERLREVVRDLVFEQLLARKAADAGITSASPEIKQRLDNYRELALNRIFFEREVQPRLAALTEESQKKFYEEKKSEYYTKPEQWHLQEIFLMLHRPYVVKEGDTLEKIAREQAGDPAAIGRILRNDRLHYPRLAPEPVRNQVPFEDVKPGERLLVPVSKETETSLTALASDIAAQLARGASFDELARKYSDTPVNDKATSFVADFAGMRPELLQAITATTVGKVTGPVRTPFGLHFLRVADYRATSTEAFQEAQRFIEVSEDEMKRNADRVKREFFDRLAERHGLKIATDILQRPDHASPDPLVGTTVIAEAPGFTYTLDDFRRDMLPTQKNWTAMTAAERINLAKAAPKVIGFLIREESRRLKLDQSPEFLAEMESKAVIEVVAAYLRQLERERAEPSESVLRAFYTKNVDRYTSPPRVTVRELTKRVDMALPEDQRKAAIERRRAELNALRQSLKSLSDFEQAARRESESLATRSRGGLIGTVPLDFRGKVFANQLSQLKPGEVSEPFLYGAEMMLVRLDEWFPATPVPFEQVLARVKAEYMREHAQEADRKLREDTLKEYSVRLLF